MENTLTPEHLHDALKSLYKTAVAQTPLLEMRQFKLLRAENLSDRAAHFQLLEGLLEELAIRQKQHAQILRERFIEKQSAAAVAPMFHLAESTIWARQREALRMLVDVALRRERKLQSEVEAQLDSRLPQPTYFKLVGVAQQIDEVHRLLVEDSGGGIVVVNGMGGLGKSSLADAVVRHLLRAGDFLEVAWASPQQSRFGFVGQIEVGATQNLTTEALIDEIGLQLLPDLFQAPMTTRFQKVAALRERFKSRPHLIVLDNVEMLANQDELIATIRPWLNPSRFLLASRSRFVPQPNVRSYSLPPLGEADALTLIRDLATRLEATSDIVSAPDDRLRPIYQTVGGNPLALRLVVGQSAVRGLDFVLQDLRTARGKKTETLYTYIFRSAWEALDELARQLWLVMPIIHDQGGSMEMLAASAGMSIDELGGALEQLVERNLVDARGGLEPRYSIHNLTRTFLEEQIAQWE